MESTRPDQISPAGLLPPEVLTLVLTEALSATPDPGPWGRLHQTRAFQLTCVAWSREIPLRTEVVAQGQRAVTRQVLTSALSSPLVRRVTLDFGDTATWSGTADLSTKLSLVMALHASVGEFGREALVAGRAEDDDGSELPMCANAGPRARFESERRRWSTAVINSANVMCHCGGYDFDFRPGTNVEEAA